MNAPAVSSPRLMRAGAGLAAVVFALFAALLPAAPASAHDQLVAADPGADTVLQALPAEITLTYSAELLGDAASNIVEVTDAAGVSLNDGAAVVDGVNVTQALAGEASGIITVLWRVVSSDGHPISGEFSFTVEGTATPTPTLSEPSATESPEPMMTTMAPPAETETPAPGAGSEASEADPLPWVVGAVVVLLVIGVVVYLLVIRPRRTRSGSAGTGTGTGD